MFEPTSFGLALALNLLVLLAWGSWGSLFKVSQANFMLWFINFAVGSFLAGAAMALTLGQMECEGCSDDTFFASLRQGSWERIALAFCGGCLVNIANYLITGAIELAGLSVAFPLTIGSGLCLGTVLTYAIDTQGSAEHIVAGVACAFAGVCFVALSSAAKTEQAEGGNSGKAVRPATATPFSNGGVQMTAPTALNSRLSNDSNGNDLNASRSTSTSSSKSPGEETSPADVGAGKVVVEVAPFPPDHFSSSTAATATTKAQQCKGVWLAVVGGLFTGGWSPLGVLAQREGEGRLNVYAMTFVFLLGSAVSIFPINAYFLSRPLAGPPALLSDYWGKGLQRWHLLGLLGGALSGSGLVLKFLAGDKLGFAISYSIAQCSPLVAVLQGVVCFGEYKGAGTTAKLHLVLMTVFYIAAIALLSRPWEQ